ncbi:MAG: DinB family protein [Candidatus Acidiferrales bacterium]|jgi:uncharacterized damage-inducible protein DinB
MEIQNIGAFLDYFDKVRGRTLRVVRCAPPDRLDWTFREGRWTLGDLIRHIAATERYIFAENIQSNATKYSGCGKELAEGYDNVLAFVNRLHAESIEIFGRLSNEDLKRKCLTPDGQPIAVWKWLRAMVEHEIHHRGQLYIYLAMLGVPTPPLYGLTSEQVRERSTTLG